MRPLLLATLACSIGITATAQHSLPQHRLLRPQAKQHRAHWTPATNTANKTTLDRRLIKVLRVSNTPPDSTTYTYSQGRGSKWITASEERQGDPYQNLSGPMNTDLQDYVANYDESIAREWGSLKFLATYNTNHQPTSIIMYQWNSATSAWDLSTKNVLKYNGTLRTDDTGYSYNTSTSSWDFDYRKHYAYNAAGKLTEDATYGASSLEQKETFTYDAQNRLIQEENIENASQPNPSKWKQDFTYGTNSISYVAQQQPPHLSAYRNYSKGTMYTKPNGQFLYGAEWQWDTLASVWETTPLSLDSFTYDANNKLINNKSFYEYNNTPSYQISTYTRNAAGQLLVRQSQNSSDGINYSNFWKEIWMYDSYGLPTTTATQSWKTATNAWDDSTSVRRYFYEDYTASIADKSTSAITQTDLYPNPVSTATTYISFFTAKASPAAITLMDATGKILNQVEEHASIGDHMVALDVKALPSGIYFITIRTAEASPVTMKLQRQ